MDIDINAIRQAIARREGQAPTPPVAQVSQPAGQLPSGAPNVPVSTPPTTPVPTPSQATPANPMVPAQKKPSLAQSANFDDETRGLVKQLITKLMGTL